MEANPVDNPISGQILDITLYAADLYAKINTTPEIWLCTLVSPAHVRLYEQRGFSPHYDRFDECAHLLKRLK
ncbi:hypothetical protein GCM10007877_32160 [Marinibactrum halimedae]|uniref:Uncharacterized protein n=1 Tax=Marinibactrum halimedae TaxID=1444977 RepID=A0AA37T9R8_9GAMM|nr:hypothetical protein GCM10007877_32160 [Marinibactrum halimedae]